MIKRTTKKTPARNRTTKRRCRHTGRAIAIIGVDVEAYACRKCDAVGVRSLGPSNDDSPAVQIEIRAAEISACHGPRMNETEARGYGQHPFDTDDTDHSPAWFAGWLASEMDLLLEEGEPYDAEAWPWDPKRSVAGQYEEHLARLHVAAKLSEPTSVLEQMRAAIDLDPVPNPNALAAVAIAGLDVDIVSSGVLVPIADAFSVMTPEERADLDAQIAQFDREKAYESQRTADPDPRDEDGSDAEPTP